MLFIHPMWDSETQRLGKKACTPAGYALHVFAEWIGFLGFLILVISGIVWLWRWLAGAPRGLAVAGLTLALVMGVTSEVIFHVSWRLALRRGFQYDGHEASWSENGSRKSYRFTA
jgi:hypothetical protein